MTPLFLCPHSVYSKNFYGMNQEEFNYWGEITAGSSCRWREDTITRLSGWGALYYMGGESGAFIRISPEGMLQMGTYEEAMPHIGEAISTVKAEKNCGIPMRLSIRRQSVFDRYIFE